MKMSSQDPLMNHCKFLEFSWQEVKSVARLNFIRLGRLGAKYFLFTQSLKDGNSTARGFKQVEKI